MSDGAVDFGGDDGMRIGVCLMFYIATSPLSDATFAEVCSRDSSHDEVYHTCRPSVGLLQPCRFIPAHGAIGCMKAGCSYMSLSAVALRKHCESGQCHAVMRTAESVCGEPGLR